MPASREQLTQRWTTADGRKRLRSVVERITGRWHTVLDGFPFVSDVASGRDLRGADFTRDELRVTQLPVADLRRANLEQTDLSYCNLRGTDLSDAFLASATLARSDLTHACLCRASLSGCDLQGATLHHVLLDEADLRGATLNGANLSNSRFCDATLSWAKLVRVNLRDSVLTGAHLFEADLRRSDLRGACFRDADLSWARLMEADLQTADLAGANLTNARLRDANMSGAVLTYANLSNALLLRTTLVSADLRNAILVRTTLKGANLSNSRTFGISAWSLNLEDARQDNLIISDDGEPTITVDSIEVAQFIYLLLNNAKIRDLIDTITSKVVLILGRFLPHRKTTLNRIRDELRSHNYLPVLCDFAGPESRDLTETVCTLAHLARMIIADLTEPSCVPHELQAVVPSLSVPVVPLIQKGHKPYAMFGDMKKYPWVLEVSEYTDDAQLASEVLPVAVRKAEDKRRVVTN